MSGLARVYATLLDHVEMHLLVVVIETKPETETTDHWTVGIVMTTDATTTAIQNTTILGDGGMMVSAKRD